MAPDGPPPRHINDPDSLIDVRQRVAARERRFGLFAGAPANRADRARDAAGGRRAQALEYLPGLLGRAGWERDDELLAAVVAQQIHLAQVAAPHRRRLSAA